MRTLLISLSLFVLTACGRTNSPASPNDDAVSGVSGKIEGPAVNTLSHDGLQSTLAECMKYGKMDDPRVKYTSRYCSAVMSAHLSEGYTKAAHSNVDPNINRLH
jgi:hypothetical protein